ncbi:unnamed protein product [Ceutorhynchus assimilis]|uniref:NADH dehydrogenase [ubiquinone] 1 alpha subcomplex subunit 6 n=1 Tax=Ceutorhynchus assimilis TaxID=467358 RepID=A0A9N9MC80_9CUCU|nr:unnamed protein product [Ceutorhynchus assimilis]
MASETAKRILKEVKPILSLDRFEAKRRVIKLYKAWFRQIPYIIKHFDIEYNEERCQAKLREEFTKYDTIKDIRVIDMLVIKGQMELNEASQKWTTRRGVVKYFDGGGHIDPKPDCFMAKFLSGKD